MSSRSTGVALPEGRRSPVSAAARFWAALRSAIHALGIGRIRRALRRRRYRLRLAANYRYDEDRFLQHADPFREFGSRESHSAYLVMLAHSIEKGLALPEPRLGFGETKIRDLFEAVGSYLDRYGPDHTVAMTTKALEAYAEFHRVRGGVPSFVSDGLSRLGGRMGSVSEPTLAGGVLEVTRRGVLEAARRDLAPFFESRFSVRQFAPVPVDEADILRAVEMAQKAPSVCNRQSGRVYVFANDELGREVLACQAGNQGFGHTADKILVITSELGRFLSVGERNQCWIDGGLFAMSLIYGLHSLGLGTCCLNWSVERDADQRLREVAQLLPSENVIMLLAVGHLPEEFSVARSQRLPLEAVATFRRSPR